MSLSKEWKNRINIWLEELQRHFYKKCLDVDFEGFFTMDHLSIQEVSKETFSPMPVGTKWGKKWEYGWFKATIVIPKELEGETIALKIGLGPEMLVYVNGEESGAIDHKHFEIILSKQALPLQKFEIICECYAGHGLRPENGKPTPPGEIALPEPEYFQVCIKESSIGTWNNDAFNLYADAFVLLSLRNNINENLLRVSKIDKALKDFTIITDFELETKQRNESFKMAIETLKPLLLCVNGSTAPEMYTFGQSHLDLAWLWSVAETKRKSARTISSFIALIKDYPNTKFLITQAPVFLYLKEYYPNLYEKVKQNIENGSIIAEGAMWLESDTNLPSGESLVRQFIYGKKFLKEEFDIDGKLLWLPDCFGFSAALPQIMQGCRVPYFSTQKISKSYNHTKLFPYNNFYWEGIDGTQVLSHVYKNINSETDPATIITRWETDRVQKDDISKLIMPFGYGDGGGGPTRMQLEYLKRTKNLEGVPIAKSSDPIEFFEDMAKDIQMEQKPNVHVGEMYFASHRGTYTSQAKTKKGNRKSEFALRDLEFWSSFDFLINKNDYDYDAIEALWKKVLFNQFHDIIPGSSIKRVHDEAEKDFLDVILKSTDLTNEKIEKFVTQQNNNFSVLNSLNWKRSEIISLGAFSENYNLEGQIFEDKFYTQINANACGITPVVSSNQDFDNDNELTICKATENNKTDYIIENKFLKVKLNNIGEIVSIVDKNTLNELLTNNANKLKMYKDVPNNYDAWDIDSMYDMLPVDITDTNATVEIVANGSLFICVRVKRNLNESSFEQDIYFYKNSPRIDFKTKIDWKESHKLLKVEFPTNIQTSEIVNEIQFGHLKRSNRKSPTIESDKFEVCNHKWSALCESNRGVAILNDCKYGISSEYGTISLTLLKSALIPDMYADKGYHEFTYSFYNFNTSLDKSDVVQQSYELNNPLLVVLGDSKKETFLSTDNNSIIIESVKLSEDKSGSLVVRLYEAYNTTCKCNITTSFETKNACLTNILEEKIEDIFVDNNKISLEFKPFEIKTLMIN